MILASAGSGKTYRLTDRYLELMSLGVEPEKIIALTFTRKAAGEFFDAILRKLVEAIRDEGKLRELRVGTGQADLGVDECHGMVRTLVARLHLLRLGTLDSFLASILRTFPLEHGMGGSFEMLDEAGMARARREVYRRVFEVAGRSGEAAFLEAFKQSTFGREERSLVRNLDGFVDQYHRIYLWGPDGRHWGNPGLIWPEGQPLLLRPPDASSAAVELGELLERRELSDQSLAKWREILAEVPALRPGGKLGKSLDTPMKNLFEAYPAIVAGTATFAIGGKRYEYDASECGRIADLLNWVLYCELMARVESTRGIWQVMERYEGQYADTVRRAGKLTFEDVQNILAGVIRASDEDVKCDINFRLDGHFDHWLLDEFQDTNFAQWRAIRELVDEVVQDPSGRRSFFYVGDVKQAIYGWRGGDSRLFGEVRDRYNQGEEGPIYQLPAMNKSWRSGPAVIGAVNAAFGNPERMGKLLPAATVERWRESWEEHCVEHEDRDGVVQFLQAKDELEKFALAMSLLEEIRPHERGMSCAIIVRRNEDGKAIAEYIRAHSDIPVVVGADIPLGADNPVIAALISLLKFAAHPGDGYSWEHVKMSPIGPLIDGRGLGKEGVVREVLEDVHAGGFESVLDRWLVRLAGAGVSLDEYSRMKLDELREATRVVDVKGERDVMAYIEFVEAYRSSDAEAEGVVQVMTIHASKGLEYDMVLLPGLDGNKGMDDLGRVPVAVKKGGERDVEWVLEFPTKRVWEQDEVLREMVEGKRAEGAFEGLCALYVAMTRAIHANYIITEKPKTAMSSAKYLAEMIGGEEKEWRMDEAEGVAIYEVGDVDWYQSRAVATKAAHDFSGPSWIGGGRGERHFPRRVRRLPSAASEEGTRSVIGNYFAKERRAALVFGSVVHALFEAIEWVEERDEVIRGDFGGRPLIEAEEVERAEAEVLACVEKSAVAELFRRSKWGADVEVWRERAFEVVREGEWISGVFDRVMVERDDAGSVRRAVVVDFKTDRLGGGKRADALAKRYVGQLEIYREVLGRMLGVEVGMIECGLVFTAGPELIWV